MAASVTLHSQLASIMEVLANAAVAEICQLVDDGFANLRLEVSRCRRENLALKSRLKLVDLRAGQRTPREPVPPLLITCPRPDHHFEEDGPAISKSTSLENTEGQQSKLVDVMDQEMDVTEQALEPEVVAVKKERLEEEQTSCCVLQDHETEALSCSIGAQSLCPAAAESIHLLPVGAQVPRDSLPRCSESQDVAGEADTLSLYCLPAEQSLRQMTDLTKEEDKQVCAVHPKDFASAESSGNKAADAETVDLEVSLNTGPKCADWTEDAASTAVKLEAEPSWSEAFRTNSPLVCVGGIECMSSSDFADINRQTDGDAAQMDPSCLDSCSFNDLFSSPEVARSLTAPRKHSTGIEESLPPSSFSFLTSSGNPSSSDCLTGSSECSSTERAFSCQQCSRLFSTPRDLLVHQRSHAGQRIYHCYMCKKPFLNPHQLKTHQRVHTGEKPFSCTQCGKRFSQSSHIKRHMSVHTGEKRYSCSLCGKRFSQACSLKVHQAVHTGERPYSCTKCGKSFSVLGNLVRHQSVHVRK